MEVADISRVVPVRRRGNCWSVDVDARHFVWIVVRKPYGHHVGATAGLKSSTGKNGPFCGWAQLDDREGLLRLVELLLDAGNIHGHLIQYSPPRFSFMVRGFLVPISDELARPTLRISPLGRI